jgi:hypothetical protein
MRHALLLAAVWVITVAVQPLTREVVYGGAVTLGDQVVPSYDNGFLMYLHHPNRLQVFRSDTRLAFDLELPCPGTGQCSATATAADGHARIAVGFAYWSENGRASGIRILDLKGNPVSFIDTSRYVPGMLCFDRTGDLWSLGWERDPLIGATENKQDYSLVRKYSADGKLLGEYLPRSLWPAKASPGAGGRGYWRMADASDRIGVLIHRSSAGQLTEWVEWDLTGKLLSRTPLPDEPSGGRGFTANGRLYALFYPKEPRDAVLRVLDTNTGTWTPVPHNLPDHIRTQGVFLLGADGDELVYRVAGGGNVRLVWARPGAS